MENLYRNRAEYGDKKDNKTKKTYEKQEGWKGKVLPFDLIKSEYYSDDYDKISKLIAEADAQVSEYTDIWENMDDDVKSVVCKDDDEASFDVKKLKSAVKNKAVDQASADSIIAIQNACAKEKDLRKQAKAITTELDNKAKEKIETLSESEVYGLLEKKWILPIISAINKVAEDVINKFTSDFLALKKKYSDPLSEISIGIEETTHALKLGLEDLTGGDMDTEAIKMLLEEL